MSTRPWALMLAALAGCADPVSPSSDAGVGYDGGSLPIDGGPPVPRDAAPLGPEISLIGRFDTSTAGEAVFDWSASTIAARFTGSQVSVTLDVRGTKAFFEVILDDVAQPVLMPAVGPQTMMLGTGLSDQPHTIELVRRDESENGPVAFQGFDFGPGGVLLPPPPRAAHRIEVIGDSITAGYGNECPPWDEATGIRENAYLAWGPLAARNLDAEIHVQAQSGIALSFGGPPMPELWLRTIRSDADSHWDFTSWIPDAVVINLGSNDWFAGGDPSDAYRAAYPPFLDSIRAVYPDAYIVLAMGPMLGDPGATQERTILQSIVSARQTAGDTRIGMLEFPHDDGSLGWGCAGHPSVAEDAVMAALLEDTLRAALGW